MALTRRSGQRFQASIWPGFVDAMTALLLVLMFVLSIFMIMQGVLKETITGQESQLSSLNSQLSALSEALGMQRRRAASLEEQVGTLGSALDTARGEAAERAATIATLQGQLARQEADLEAQADELRSARADITDFEAQVARLLAERDKARARGAVLEQDVAALEKTRSDLVSEQDRLQTALASARDEMDARVEAARLAAARREALEALVADLRAKADEGDKTRSALAGQVDELQQKLSDEEAARLAEAEAATALRDKLKTSQDELTAMTLSLEEARRKAEETLTLLAAAEVAKQKLAEARAAAETATEDARAQVRQAEAAKEAALKAAEARAEDARAEANRQAALLAQANSLLDQKEVASAESQQKLALLNQQLAALRSQLGDLQGLLNSSEAREAAAKVQIDSLGTRLNAALARAAAEQRARARLEETERKRLEEEAKRQAERAKNLENYRSEFFGELRRLLADREGVRIVGDRFVFSSEVLFEPGSAQLSADGKAQIANVVGILRDVADQIPPEIDWILRVDGHTDDVPLGAGAEFADNWELSQARALSVVRYMIDDLGFPPQRLAATGFGQYQPVAQGESPEARAQNRRIELKLTER